MFWDALMALMEKAVNQEREEQGVFETMAEVLGVFEEEESSSDDDVHVTTVPPDLQTATPETGTQTITEDAEGNCKVS